MNLGSAYGYTHTVMTIFSTHDAHIKSTATVVIVKSDTNVHLIPHITAHSDRCGL